MHKINPVSARLVNQPHQSQWPDRLRRLKLFLALSRTPHGLLDMATPALSVIIYLGGFPRLGIIVLGLITAFSGYTAIYALNDLVDYRSDQMKADQSADNAPDSYLDSAMVRHPLAQNLLSYQEALAWTVGWGCVALIGAYLLNPVCILIFLGGAILEFIYCRMWRVSPWRAVVSGVVKTIGAIAAVFAVDPSPSPVFLFVLFCGLFFWEIGGQNIPADWVDIDVDRRFKAQTIPVSLGEYAAAKIVIFSLTCAVIICTVVFRLGFPAIHWTAILMILLTGIFLLIVPGLKLFKTRLHDQAMNLFNRASYFPLALLIIAAMLIWSHPLLASDQGLCDAHHGTCEMTVNGRAITLDITPKPVKAMQSLLFTVTVSGAPLPKMPYIDLGMPGMNMGPNRVILSEKESNVFEGQGVIVRCKSGKRIWQAIVTLPDIGKCKFIFDVIY